MTYYEIAHGELAEGQGKINEVLRFFVVVVIHQLSKIEFFELDKTLLNKALNILVKRGTAQIFKGSDEDSMGVKFFGSQ